MVILGGTLAALLTGFVAAMGLWIHGYVDDFRHLRLPTPEAVRFVPDPVGTHPAGSQPWFLVVGDSISAGISPAQLGGEANPSWVGALSRDLRSSGFAWQPDDLACPSENTHTYVTGCPLAFTNPLLGSKPQRDVALRDIQAHGATLKFIIVELGANDLFSMKDSHYINDTADLVGRLRVITDELRHAAPGVPLLLANIYNPYAVDRPASQLGLDHVDRAIRTLAADEHAFLVDFAGAIVPGGTTTRENLCRLIDCQHHDIHPTLAGQQVLADAAERALDAAGVLQPFLLL